MKKSNIWFNIKMELGEEETKKTEMNGSVFQS